MTKSMHENLRYWFFLEKRPKNPAIWLDKRHNWLHPIKNGSLKCHLALVRNFMHKKQRKLLIYSRDIIDQRILQSDWKRHTYLHPTKSGSLRYYLTWWLIISMQKFKDINWNHPKILLIKQSSNLTWWERHTQPHPTKSQPAKLTTKRQFIFVMANKKEIIGN